MYIFRGLGGLLSGVIVAPVCVPHSGSFQGSDAHECVPPCPDGCGLGETSQDVGASLPC